jgi:hypothetical protein
LLLKIGVDTRDGHANTPVAALHGSPELECHQDDQRHHGQQQPSHTRAQFQHGPDDEGQHQKIAEDHQQPGRKQFVQGVNIAGDASNHAAHRVVVVISEIQALHVPHQLPPQIEHRLLADPLHQVLFAEIAQHSADDRQQI